MVCNFLLNSVLTTVTTGIWISLRIRLFWEEEGLQHFKLPELASKLPVVNFLHCYFWSLKPTLL